MKKHTMAGCLTKATPAPFAATASAAWKTAGLLLALVLALALGAGPARAGAWKELSPGLALGRFSAHLKASLGDSTVTVLRIDPAYWRFRLVAASQFDKKARTVAAWAKRFKLAAAINAGLYRKDLLTSTGYMKNFDHVNNRRLTPEYHSVFAFNPTNSLAPAVKLYDLKCEPFFGFFKYYETLIQGIRMLSCFGENRWTARPRKFSIAALGQDAEGKILFLLCRSPYRAHDFVNIVMRLPLRLQRMMYLEGGYQASLYVKAGGKEIRAMGMPASGARGKKGRQFWPVPNVIGIVPR